MPQPARRTVRTSVILPETQYARLSEIANRSDVSVAWLIRQAVQQLLDKTENEQMPLPIRVLRGEGNA